MKAEQEHRCGKSVSSNPHVFLLLPVFSVLYPKLSHILYYRTLQHVGLCAREPSRKRFSIHANMFSCFLHTQAIVKLIFHILPDIPGPCRSPPSNKRFSSQPLVLPHRQVGLGRMCSVCANPILRGTGQKFASHSPHMV